MAVTGGGDVRGEIEVPWADAAFAELRQDLSLQIKAHDAVLLRVGDEQAVAGNHQAGRTFEIVIDLEAEFSVRFESDDHSESRVRHEQDVSLSRYCHRRGKANL